MNRRQQRVVKGVTAMMGLCIVGYIVGPPLYWHVSEGLAAAVRSSCPPCLCDCSFRPLVSLSDAFTICVSLCFHAGMSNNSLLDCMKSDPELSEETEKSFTELLSEEVKLREIQALENQRRADRALLEAKKVASQYQKEADKCNMGMETCEEAREKAEAALETQRKLSAMWEIRARQRGWRDSLVRPRVY
ncbi:uncharacterized protein LOC110808062 isoform X1 [Carica papaya]|uniref:uncharacterized protein LOC110808062 isoform X1 n=1 Tax=Carica papaya TaxID=3649 RepID=UPI000B8CD117|nr:uncharacterized protein LOC110808062 isoform X1 [Carica papaya]